MNRKCLLSLIMLGVVLSASSCVPILGYYVNNYIIEQKEEQIRENCRKEIEKYEYMRADDADC